MGALFVQHHQLQRPHKHRIDVTLNPLRSRFSGLLLVNWGVFLASLAFVASRYWQKLKVGTIVWLADGLFDKHESILHFNCVITKVIVLLCIVL